MPLLPRPSTSLDAGCGSVPPNDPAGPLDGMDADEDRTEYHLVVIPRRPGDVWPLTGPYLELVYGSLLGPTATLLARRLGHLVDSHRHRAALSIDDLGASLSIPPARVIAGLRRLHHHGLVVFAPAEGLLGVSGFAPTLIPEQLARVSASSQLEHRRLTAQPPAAPPPPAPPAGAPSGVSLRAAARLVQAARRPVGRSW